MQPFGGCLTRMAAFTHVPAQDELSSDVVGLDVYNKEKQNIGTIKDIALDASGLKGYVVGVGGLPQHALETITNSLPHAIRKDFVGTMPRYGRHSAGPPGRGVRVPHRAMPAR